LTTSTRRRPRAPRRGRIALGTYDNFNVVVDGVKGTLALGLDLNYDTLLVPALDEVSIRAPGRGKLF
jgi:microcin C transport system substrate-binding protein